MTSSPNPDDAAGADPLGAEPEVRELAEVPAVEVISRAAVMLMSSAAEKLGLSEPDPAESPYLDLDEARRVITALAGLVTASVEYLGPHAGPIRDGLQALQRAFREASAHPDEVDTHEAASGECRMRLRRARAVAPVDCCAYRTAGLIGQRRPYEACASSERPSPAERRRTHE